LPFFAIPSYTVQLIRAECFRILGWMYRQQRGKYRGWSQLAGPAITAADGTAIPCWRFLLATMAFALIGGDFLANFDLAVDLKRMRLVYKQHLILQLQEPPWHGVSAQHQRRQ
jgi:hypothetical protein